MSENPSCERWEREHAGEILGRDFGLSSAPVARHNLHFIPFYQSNNPKFGLELGLDFPKVKPGLPGAAGSSSARSRGMDLGAGLCIPKDARNPPEAAAQPCPGYSHFSV